MAKQREDKEVNKNVVDDVDYVKLVQGSTKAMGIAPFMRVKLDINITTPGLLALNEAYKDSEYEVFINGKHILLLKK